MSKASEWAEKMSKIFMSRPGIVLRGYSFKLDNGANLLFPSMDYLTPDDALKLGRWILETFGDEDREGVPDDVEVVKHDG